MTQPAPTPQIGVCFYGITRALPRTAPAIEAQILAPLQRRASVVRLGHFFATSADATEHVAYDAAALLQLDAQRTEPPHACLTPLGFDALLAAGDFWNNAGVSLRNLVHQLHSLQQVTEMALSRGVTHCLFLRPDLLYHDSIEPHLDRFLSASAPLAMIPDWQHWKGGMNDRFAFCVGPEAMRAWGGRAGLMHRYCAMTGAPLHSERLVAFALHGHDIPTQTLPLRASRVRANGAMADEDFRPRRIKRLRQRLLLMRHWARLGIVRGFAGPAV